MTEQIRVFQVATGNVGTEMIKRIAAHPDLSLIGLQCYTPEKVGRDAGEIAGLAPNGVIATGSVEEIIAAGPDVVTFHVPENPETFHMLNRETMRLLKPTAIVINAARGGVVDQDALAEALAEHRIAGAGVGNAAGLGHRGVLAADNRDRRVVVRSGDVDNDVVAGGAVERRHGERVGDRLAGGQMVGQALVERVGPRPRGRLECAAAVSADHRGVGVAIVLAAVDVGHA